MARAQEMDNVELDQLRQVIKALQREKGIKLENFTSKDISYVYLRMFLSGKRNLSSKTYAALVSNINIYLDSLK